MLKRRGLTRREMLERGGLVVAGAGGLTLAGIGGYAWPHDQAAAASIATAPATPDDDRGVLHFVTRPDLTPPALTLAHHDRAGTARPAGPEYLILAPAGYPRTGPGTPGLMIATAAAASSGTRRTPAPRRAGARAGWTSRCSLTGASPCSPGGRAR